jgi:predicted ATPase
MFKSIRFQNFKVLRDTELPLGRFTLIVGPNGSGKSTALEALKRVAYGENIDFNVFRSLAPTGKRDVIKTILVWDETAPDEVTHAIWRWNAPLQRLHERNPGQPLSDYGSMEPLHPARSRLPGLRIFSLEADRLAAYWALRPKVELGQRGEFFSAVLDRLRDHYPERFESLKTEFTRWLPEFDAIVFDTGSEGTRAIGLRTQIGQHRIPASEASQGTLLALAILTLAYLPDPPPLVGFEEPDRGLHPRLLRDVRDALYRLAFPENFGEKREPVQVIATTHNPFFLDLFRDHPEEIVIAEKTETEAKFVRLIDMPNMEEILEGANLGEVWYSGILGGVPSQP